jgi:glutamate/tyrosine decarboxylase-like PLP-dependent enzyme
MHVCMHTRAQVRTAVTEMMRDAPLAIDAGLPIEGVPVAQLMRELEELKSSDVNPSDGLTFAYVYTPFERTVHDVAHKV